MEQPGRLTSTVSSFVYSTRICFFSADASEVVGWNGNFRLKKDLHRISNLEPFINKLYGLQDFKLKSELLVKRDTDDFQEERINRQLREKRDAGKDEENYNIPYETWNTVPFDLPAKYKLYLVSNYYSRTFCSV